jgi:hypothetical protein
LVAIGSILPSIFHGKICNDVLLQLIDCIELMKNEVKKKMNAISERCCTKVTFRGARARKSRRRYNETPRHDAIQRAEDGKTIVPAHLLRSQSHERMAKQTSSHKFIFCALGCIYNEVAKLRGSMINGGFR